MQFILPKYFLKIKLDSQINLYLLKSENNGSMSQISVFHVSFLPPLKAILGMSISESLNIVENEPSQRNDHQNDERDGYE